MGRFKINEDLSVSNIVGDMCKELTYQLISKINKSKKYIYAEKSFLISKGFINFDCRKYLKNLQWLNVIYVVYYFDTEKEYEYNERHGLLNSSADYQNKNIKLKLAYINDKPARDFSSCISHELKHIYEYDCGMTKNKNFYQRVLNKLGSGEEWEKIVAWALYLSFKTEQDAFLSQFYEYLKTNRQYVYDPLRDKKSPYHQYDEAFNNVDKLNFTEEQVKDSFGLTINQLYHILDSADDRLYKKISHVWQKYNNEINYGSVRPSYAEFMFECFNKGIKEFDVDDQY